MKKNNPHDDKYKEERAKEQMKKDAILLFRSGRMSFTRYLKIMLDEEDDGLIFKRK